MIYYYLIFFFLEIEKENEYYYISYNKYYKNIKLGWG